MAAIKVLQQADRAPDFTLPAVFPDKSGDLRLSALAGQPVILYFYPKDDTPGCTKQACAFRDALPDFSAAGAQIIGISKDPLARHLKFRDKYDLNFPLAADEDGAVCQAYGVWAEKNLYGRKYMGITRTTFLIDGNGIIQRIWPKVKVPGHAEEVAAAVQQMTGTA